MATTLMEIHGKEKIAAPDGFEFYFFEKLPEQGPAQVIKMVGGVAPIKIKGRNKDERNWKKMDPATKREVYLPVEEHKAWIAEWETKTGLCANCQGEGVVTAGWNVETGIRQKPCPQCGGTGQKACVA